jgi:hypothetical protein
VFRFQSIRSHDDSDLPVDPTLLDNEFYGIETVLGQWSTSNLMSEEDEASFVLPPCTSCGTVAHF